MYGGGGYEECFASVIFENETLITYNFDEIMFIVVNLMVNIHIRHSWC